MMLHETSLVTSAGGVSYLYGTTIVDAISGHDERSAKPAMRECLMCSSRETETA
jgi:hypothetical protein